MFFRDVSLSRCVLRGRNVNVGLIKLRLGGSGVRIRRFNTYSAADSGSKLTLDIVGQHHGVGNDFSFPCVHSALRFKKNHNVRVHWERRHWL